MADVEAVYQDGVFKPLAHVGLRENQKVRLRIETIDGADPDAWLAEVRQYQDRIVRERGYFPDSTLDIAEDRRRDD